MRLRPFKQDSIMGDALDDLYDQMDRQTEYCKAHKCWYEEHGFGCPVCECEAEDPASEGRDSQKS